MRSTNSSISLIVPTLLILSLFQFGAHTVMASIFGKSDLSGAWKERFQDITKLNEYTKINSKMEIRDVSIKGYNLSNAVFNNAAFNNIEWTDTSSEKISLTNTVFRGNTFNDIEFNNGTFTNVTFEDVEFNRAVFSGTEFHNVKFIRCTFKFRSAIVGLKNSSTLDFDHSTFENANFSESQANISFRNSKLNDVELTDLIFPSSIIFENSKLEDIDLDRSKLTKLAMDNVTGGGRESGFNGGSIADVEIRNTTMTFGMNSGKLGKITFINSNIDAGFNRSNIKELRIINCKDMKSLDLYQTTVESLQIANCPINKFDPIEAIVQNFSIEKSSIINSKFKKIKVENFNLTDVTLDGLLDFSNAQVEHLATKNVTKLPSLNLNLTGSNMKF